MKQYSMGAETVEAVEWNGKIGVLRWILKEWFHNLCPVELAIRLKNKDVAVKDGEWIVRRGKELSVMSADEFRRRCGGDDSGARREIEQLTLDLREHNRRYYQEAQPIITDAEYDARMKRLEEMEREHPELADPHSPTKEVE